MVDRYFSLNHSTSWRMGWENSHFMFGVV